MTEASGPPAPPARAPLPDWWWEQDLRTRQAIAAGLAVVLLVVGVFGVSRLFGGSDEAAAFVDDLSDERVALWDDLAECESGRDWSLNSGNGFYGGLQFTEESWLGVGGSDFAHQHDRNEQIMRAEALQDVQGWDAWPRCAAELGLISAE